MYLKDTTKLWKVTTDIKIGKEYINIWVGKDFTFRIKDFTFVFTPRFHLFPLFKYIIHALLGVSVYLYFLTLHIFMRVLLLLNSLFIGYQAWETYKCPTIYTLVWQKKKYAKSQIKCENCKRWMCIRGTGKL